jgi:TatD DNase family protein
MYLHSRSTEGDFPRIVKENRHKFSTGVVHSFTGDLEELNHLLEIDLYIGINGCSLKTPENCEVVKHVPLDRIMLETDSPYCQIRNSSAAAKFVKTKFPTVTKEKYKGDKMNKDRNEPCTMIQVAEAVAALIGRTEEEVCEIAWQNTLKMFNLKE